MHNGKLRMTVNRAGCYFIFMTCYIYIPPFLQEFKAVYKHFLSDVWAGTSSPEKTGRALKHTTGMMQYLTMMKKVKLCSPLDLKKKIWLMGRGSRYVILAGNPFIKTAVSSQLMYHHKKIHIWFKVLPTAVTRTFTHILNWIFPSFPKLCKL